MRLYVLEKMNPIVTPKLYTKISGIMAVYKRYPTKMDYERVAKELVGKYPFLSCPLSGHVS